MRQLFSSYEGPVLAAFYFFGSFLPLTRIKSGVLGKSLGKKEKKGKIMPLHWQNYAAGEWSVDAKWLDIAAFKTRKVEKSSSPIKRNYKKSPFI